MGRTGNELLVCSFPLIRRKIDNPRTRETRARSTSMLRILSRTLVFLLVSCLVSDSTLASICSDRPLIEGTRLTHQMCGMSSPQFLEQALSTPLLASTLFDRVLFAGRRVKETFGGLLHRQGRGHPGSQRHAISETGKARLSLITALVLAGVLLASGIYYLNVWKSLHPGYSISSILRHQTIPLPEKPATTNFEADEGIPSDKANAFVLSFTKMADALLLEYQNDSSSPPESVEDLRSFWRFAYSGMHLVGESNNRSPL